MARYKADEALAAYYVKGNIERDLRWMGKSLDHTKKDEFLILLMAMPLIGLFIPWTRGIIADGFNALKVIHPDAPAYFLYGWAIIFVATFGMKSAFSYIWPNRAANLVTAMNSVDDEVPGAAVRRAETATRTPFDPTSGVTNQ